jgi:CDP-diglyceride synthetase
MNVVACLQLIILLTLANGSPVIAKRVMGDRLAAPVDGGFILPDGAPLFGRSKTVRGIVLAVLVTAIGAPIVGLDWRLGAIVGTTAMLGDLLSSFIKRRLKLVPSAQATGLDQIPESLLPALASRAPMALGLVDIAAVVAIFLIGEIVLSRLLYALRIRDRPY